MSELSPKGGSEGYEVHNGAPAKANFSFCGERRSSEMSELSPKAEARDMKLATTRFT